MSSNKNEIADPQNNPSESKEQNCESGTNENLNVKNSETPKNFENKVNMGSNMEAEISKNEDVPEASKCQENYENDQKILENKAENVVGQEDQIENVEDESGKDGKNVSETIDIKKAEEQPSEIKNEGKEPKEVQNDTPICEEMKVEDPENNEKGPATSVMETNNLENSNLTPNVEEASKEQEEVAPSPIVQNTEVAPSIPIESGESEKTNKNLGSMAGQQITPKRSLRERKSRQTRGSDSGNKCHL